MSAASLTKRLRYAGALVFLAAVLAIAMVAARDAVLLAWAPFWYVAFMTYCYIPYRRSATAPSPWLLGWFRFLTFRYPPTGRWLFAAEPWRPKRPS